MRIVYVREGGCYLFWNTPSYSASALTRPSKEVNKMSILITVRALAYHLGSMIGVFDDEDEDVEDGSDEE